MESKKSALDLVALILSIGNAIAERCRLRHGRRSPGAGAAGDLGALV